MDFSFVLRKLYCDYTLIRETILYIFLNFGPLNFEHGNFNFIE